MKENLFVGVSEHFFGKGLFIRKRPRARKAMYRSFGDSAVLYEQKVVGGGNDSL